MKKFLIILFTFIFVVSAGLLVYGAIQGPQELRGDSTKGMLGVPAEGLFSDAEHPQQSIKSIVSDSAMNGAEKAATMLVNASYNMNSIDRFYGHCRVDTEIPSADKHFFSDYYRGKSGVSMYYHTLVHTGFKLSDVFSFKIDYADPETPENGQRLKKTGQCSYDFDEEKYSYAVGKPSVESNSLSRGADTPYLIYSWFDFPLDLGGKKSANGYARPDTDAIDSSLIDASTVKIEEKGSKNEKYYELTFKAIVAKAQASNETVYRFYDTNKLDSDVEFHEIAVTAQIWKESGVFRELKYEVSAVIEKSGNRGEGEITKTWQFSYDEADCSVAKRINDLGEDWVKKLSAENQAAVAKEVAALPKSDESGDAE
ncbi:MAG: hypothetical protein IJT69_05340 [Clostridia bacterium]|nr:hypothetical protein [Clostridia bacterium]